ncbi:MAG: hypothetical protein AAGC81_01865 [Pseudomonadota bacterium]
MNITDAVYNRLAADAGVVALLAAYNGAPAIFTNTTVPGDAPRPYLWSPGDTAGTTFDNLDEFGRDVTRDVICIADDTGSSAPVEALKEAVYSAMHRQNLTVPGGRHVMTIFAGEGVAPTDDTLTGRFITFRIVIMEA